MIFSAALRPTKGFKGTQDKFLVYKCINSKKMIQILSIKEMCLRMYFPLKLLAKFIMKYVFINIFIIQRETIHTRI